jgi:hypothetical protein
MTLLRGVSLSLTLFLFASLFVLLPSRVCTNSGTSLAAGTTGFLQTYSQSEITLFAQLLAVSKTARYVVCI